MRKIIYALMVSMDGYMEGPNGALGWSEPGEDLHQHFNDLYLSGEIDTSIYGRKLYEIMAAYWPNAEDNPDTPRVETEFSKLWKKIPKIVYSKTLESVDWNSTLRREVDPEEIRKLKSSPGKNIDLGGADLAADFIRHNLIDEYRLYIHPVLLGGGKPMFPVSGKSRNLQLFDTQSFSGGVVMLRYTAIN